MIAKIKDVEINTVVAFGKKKVRRFSREMSCLVGKHVEL
jgi:hypothetical protein